MVRGTVPGAGRRLRRLCKWDGLSSDAQHTSKKSGMSMHACNPSRGKQVPGTHWPASLNCWIPDALRPRLKGKPQKLWWWWRRWEVWLRKMPKLASTHTHWCTFIHAHANTSMHTWTSTSHCIPMKTLFPLLSMRKTAQDISSSSQVTLCLPVNILLFGIILKESHSFSVVHYGLLL